MISLDYLKPFNSTINNCSLGSSSFLTASARWLSEGFGSVFGNLGRDLKCFVKVRKTKPFIVGLVVCNMDRKEIYKILKKYKILEYEEGNNLIWVKLQGAEGSLMFNLPKELNSLIYSFEVYFNGQICLYLNKRLKNG